MDFLSGNDNLLVSLSRALDEAIVSLKTANIAGPENVRIDVKMKEWPVVGINGEGNSVQNRSVTQMQLYTSSCS